MPHTPPARDCKRALTGTPVLLLSFQSLELTCDSGAAANQEDDNTKGLSGYGVKTIEGVNKLSGPGLPVADLPGILMGGAKWPGRLKNKCGEIMGEYGEDEIMATFEKGFGKGWGAGALFTDFCKDSCSDEEYEAFTKKLAPAGKKEL